MVRWTRFVIAHRKRVLIAWLVVVVVAGIASAVVSKLLSNRFSLPGAEPEKGFTTLRDHFGAQGQGYTLVVVKQPSVSSRALIRLTQNAVNRAAKPVRGQAGDVRQVGPNLLIADIDTPLEYTDASDATPKVRSAIGQIPGVRFYVTGAPAIDHDEKPLY